MTSDKRIADSDVSAEVLAKRLKVTMIIEGTDPALTSICRVGSPAPPFSVPAVQPDGTFSTVTLDDFKGQYLVLLFYPADFTFVCPTEITGFSDRLKEFSELDCAVAVISTDSEYVHYNWRQQHRANGGVGEVAVPMLADRSKEVSRRYGVLCEESGLAFRALFVVDPKQKVRAVQINDMPVGRSVDEALRLVSALKFSDEHGVVCPANWRPGNAAIRPDMQGSKAFFKEIA
ncbi:hypothetical protein GGI20_004089 [Coemansia sp. BCRC 34301]|nr:hypothetical protein GGI20_004089 [Coemansia sp. BCRC 34301]